MRLLFVAFACNPRRGSEALLGWLWPYYLRDMHEVHVVTRIENREDIESFANEKGINNINFHYVSVPDIKKKIFSKVWVLYYRVWQKELSKEMPFLMDEYHFDIIHHVSLNEFRTIRNDWKEDAKFVFGPTGGAQLTPKSLMKYTKGHRFEELSRQFINKSVVYNSTYKKSVKRCDAILCANMETYNALWPIADNRCSLMLDVGIQDRELAERKELQRQNNDCFTFLWAGRMHYRKGLLLLIDAIKKVDDKLKYQVLLCGDGKQKREITGAIEKNGLQGKVKLLGKVDYLEMQSIYLQANAFIFPSLRESVGTVIVEAMSYGIPVIGFNNGGFPLIADEKSGYFISGDNSDEIVDSIADIMTNCINNPSEVKQKGMWAYEAIKKSFTWENKVSTILDIYNSLV